MVHSIDICTVAKKISEICTLFQPIRLQIFCILKIPVAFIYLEFRGMLNPLNANSTKWSNTLKQFIGKSRQIV